MDLHRLRQYITYNIAHGYQCGIIRILEFVSYALDTNAMHDYMELYKSLIFRRLQLCKNHLVTGNFVKLCTYQYINHYIYITKKCICIVKDLE